MILEDKKKAFYGLGCFLGQFAEEPFQKDENIPFTDDFYDAFIVEINKAAHLNNWFTKDQLVFTFKSWSDALHKENIDNWTKAYDFSREPLKTVGLILAGNVPLVGFHDIISVLMSGNKAQIKLSSNDQNLIPFLLRYLVRIEPRFADRIQITKDPLQDFDAVIATGSNNTSRYFEYYFSKVPHIIRKNRHSVAVLNGNESPEDLKALGEDIFRYYGLGCRNVSKIMVPHHYNFTPFFEAIFAFSDVIHYEKYAHNYDYNKAVFLMSNYQILDNGFLTIREDKSYASPISSVFYEYYDKLQEVETRLQTDQDKIQCIVSNGLIPHSIPFGTTQMPQLWDYADHVDTIDFLLHLD